MSATRDSPTGWMAATADSGRRGLRRWLPHPVDGAARRRATLIAAILALATPLYDQAVIGVALPAIQRDLNVGSVPLQWTVNAFLLGLAVCVAVGGRVADIFTWHRAFLAGAIIFGTAAAACGLAPSLGWR